jgi:hypothetical protein
VVQFSLHLRGQPGHEVELPEGILFNVKADMQDLTRVTNELKLCGRRWRLIADLRAARDGHGCGSDEGAGGMNGNGIDATSMAFQGRPTCCQVILTVAEC